MAKLPVLKRLQREDFKDAPDWIDQLIFVINTFFDSVYNALNKNISFGENVTSEIKEFTFTTLSTYAGTVATWEQQKITTGLKKNIQGVVLLQIYKFGAPTYSPIEGDVYLDWNCIGGTITIGLIRGLAASTKYTCRVLVI